MGSVSTVVQLDNHEVANAVITAARAIAGINVGSATVTFDVADGAVTGAEVKFHKTGHAK